MKDDRYSKLRGKKRKLKNKEKLIPCGSYCYGHRPDGEYVGSCPFLSRNKSLDWQESGICLVTRNRDAAPNYGWLWDMVKSCGINEEEYEEDK